MTPAQPSGPFRLAEEALHTADMKSLEAVICSTPTVLEERACDGDTLLGLACRVATGNVALPPERGTIEQHAAVDRILTAGADPTAARTDGWAPLHTAAMTGHIDLAQRLLEAGAAREGRLLGCDGGSPLALALFYAQTDVARVLAAPPIPDSLRTAAALGHDLWRFVDGDVLTSDALVGLDFYRPLPVFPEWRRTYERQEVLDEALTWAARNSQCESMSNLTALGANVNANAYRGTALLWAVYSDSAVAANWLLDHGADPNLKHDFGGDGHGVAAVALHLGAQFGAISCLKLLLERGADPTIVDGVHGATPLDWARHGQSAEAIDLLQST
ncbi:MAG: ankyrin repeat domain-containing protein [Planctomycetota bacterium]